MTPRILLFALVALAGCSKPSDDYAGGARVSDKEARAAEAIDAAVARNGVERTALEGLPVSKPTPSAARDRALPTPFLGYWGVTPDDCELANVNATGRINIDADTIRFYESKARVDRVIDRTPYRIVADLRFSGEGQQWRRTTTFALSDGGTILTRSEAGSTQPIRYRKC